MSTLFTIHDLRRGIAGESVVVTAQKLLGLVERVDGEVAV